MWPSQAISHTFVCMMTLEKAFGMALLQARTEAELSQEELAHRAGLHTNAVSFLERGERKPGIQTIFQLSRALGIKTSELMERVENLKPKIDGLPPS